MWLSKPPGKSTGRAWLSFWSPMRLAKSSPLFVVPSMRLTLPSRPSSARNLNPLTGEYYRKGIGSRLVDMYKEAYDSVQVPKYVDTVTPEYKPKFDQLLVDLKEAEEKSLKESERLEKEIAEVQELKKKISTMTADEYFEKHPELKKKFDDEIRNDYWGY
ncbi:ATP synthase subunit d mitochondrial [Prunus yedoensis var. nudiflora]|uniref:ATP synthase subunit d mitochondrial n=1 Tax=Prunus yedoensis var. nudiflora TaxID=2094558 RepID=A0A314ZLD4_PRUYE|nr:ATP synthase subunit d mitochondrial [Prunus yedoensis var. nudiflora]